MKRVIFTIIFLLVLIQKGAYGLTPAGTSIVNKAICTYKDEKGFSYTTASNTVIVTVAKVCGIQITPDMQKLTSTSGSYIAIPFILRNTGNTADSYYLSIENLSTGKEVLLSPRIYIDKNNNGVVDIGEPIYDNDNPPKLSTGEFLPLLIFGQVPADLDSGTIKIELDGKSNCDSSKIDNGNIAVIDVQRGGFIKITKSADKLKAFPDDNLTFTISFSNPGFLPINGTRVQTDINNDGYPESETGVLIEDEIPPDTKFVSIKDFAPVNGEILYKGENDSYWKNDVTKTQGTIKSVALFIKKSQSGALLPDQEGYLKFTVKIDKFAPEENIKNVSCAYYENASSCSNEVYIHINSVPKVIADDTDDNGSYSGNGTWQDPDDLMELDSAMPGKWVEFKNEVWNLSNGPDVIDIEYDSSHSLNVPPGTIVQFYTTKGIPLTDTNMDGKVDVGEVQPGEKVEFITKVFLPNDSQNYNNIILAIKAISGRDPKVTDLTFDEIKKVENTLTQVKVLTQATVQSSVQSVPLQNEKLIVYEYDSSGKLTGKQIFWTDDNGYIRYDSNGTEVSIYEWMKPDHIYRLTLADEYKGFTYYLTPGFKKAFFDAVNAPGEEKCWDISGNEVACSVETAAVKIKVNPDGTKLLSIPLDPAGYVYDGITGERVNGACVTFYRCSDKSCSSYSEVDPTLLDLYPDGVTTQENPQISGPESTNGTNVGIWDGGFQFQFKNFNSTLEGWYFIEVGFNCNFPAADPSLKDKYLPIKLKKDEIWEPTSGEPYTGQKFYINATFPGAILMRIPLLSSSFKPLQVEKSVTPSTASIGDIVKWTIKVKNPSSSYTVYDVSVFDPLPKGLKYAKGTLSPAFSPDGRTLKWNFEKLAPEEEKEITFYTVVTPGINIGEEKNTSYAEGWSDTAHSIKINSNTAFAYLKVSKGIFTDKAYIIGKVFIDDNNNRIQDEDEKGVPGVKIYMEDGRFAVTDSEGKYHFDNVEPGTHVLKVDKTTLPPHTQLKIISNRNMGDPNSYFADVFPGDIFKVNFRVVPEKINTKTDIKVHPISGKIKVERYVNGILVDPKTKGVVVVNALKIENLSKKPLYEVRYHENSPYKPLKGTAYLNNAPFTVNEISEKSFEYRIPLIPPEETFTLKWNSYLPEKDEEALAHLYFSYKPFEDLNEKLPVNIPFVIKVIKPKVYELTVYFDFGKYELTKEAKQSLQKLADYLRKTGYKWIYIKIVGHTDNVRVSKNNKEYRSNQELSLKRAEVVKEYLKKLLINPNRLRFMK